MLSTPLHPTSSLGTPKHDNESGAITIFLRGKTGNPCDGTIIVQSDAGKAIHNYLCVLYGDASMMVKTRTKEEMQEDVKKLRK